MFATIDPTELHAVCGGVGAAAGADDAGTTVEISCSPDAQISVSNGGASPLRLRLSRMGQEMVEQMIAAQSSFNA